MKSCLIWGNGNLGYEWNEKLWTPFYNGQIQMLQFTQRWRDKQAKKTEQNTNLASKRMGELAKWKRTLCLFKGDLGQQRMDLSSFIIRSLMFVKSPEISPFPERVFSPLSLAILQSVNWTLKEFAWLVLGATKCKYRRWHQKGKESFEDAVREPGSQWSWENWDPQERTLCLLGTANTPQEGTTGTTPWPSPG